MRFFWEQTSVKRGFVLSDVLTLATGFSAGTGWGFQTEPNRILHSSSLTAAADGSVPPQPPAQEGPIKTSHITPSVCLRVPSLLFGSGKKEPPPRPAARTEPRAEKKTPTCVNSDLRGSAVVVAAPSPPRPSCIPHTRSLADPSSSGDLRGRQTEGLAGDFFCCF